MYNGILIIKNPCGRLRKTNVIAAMHANVVNIQQSHEFNN